MDAAAQKPYIHRGIRDMIPFLYAEIQIIFGSTYMQRTDITILFVSLTNYHLGLINPQARCLKLHAFLPPSHSVCKVLHNDNTCMHM